MGSIFLIALLVAAWLLHKRDYQGSAGKIKIALVVLGIVFLALTLTGRASPIFALLDAFMTQIRRLAPLLMRVAPFHAKYPDPALRPGGIGGGSEGVGGGNRSSRVTTRSITMTFDQDSGELDGVVLQGKFKDRRISEVQIDELRELYQSATTHDVEAARLIIAYASRERSEEWKKLADRPLVAIQITAPLIRRPQRLRLTKHWTS